MNAFSLSAKRPNAITLLAYNNGMVVVNCYGYWPITFYKRNNKRAAMHHVRANFTGIITTKTNAHETYIWIAPTTHNKKRVVEMCGHCPSEKPYVAF